MHDPVVSATVVGVVPAAGYARRLQPLEGSKEVLPVGERPVMDYLLERMCRVPLAELRVVTRPEKRDVVEHAKRCGAVVIEGYPRTVSESLLLGIQGLRHETVVLFGFPDTLWAGTETFPILVERVLGGAEIALAVFRTLEPARSDVVELGPDGALTRVLVKPERPPSDVVWGCLAARARALAGLEGYEEPGELLDSLSGTGTVFGVRFDEEFVDVGTREAMESLAEQSR